MDRLAEAVQMVRPLHTNTLRQSRVLHAGPVSETYRSLRLDHLEIRPQDASSSSLEDLPACSARVPGLLHPTRLL